MSQVSIRATGERTPTGAPEWMNVIHEANCIEPGVFGAPESTGPWWAGGYVEEYADARVILDTNAEGETFKGGGARLVSKTERGARALAGAAKLLGIEFQEG